MTRSVIEDDLTIEGNVTARDGEIDVKGRVAGDITARAVDIHPGGSVEGAVAADKVRIAGQLSGRVKCAELSLEKTADIRADLSAQTLASEKGARLAGKLQITGS